MHGCSCHPCSRHGCLGGSRGATCQHAQPDLPGKGSVFSSAGLKRERSCYCRRAARARSPRRLQAPVQSSNSLTLDSPVHKHTAGTTSSVPIRLMLLRNRSVMQEVQRERLKTHTRKPSTEARVKAHCLQSSMSAF